MFGAGSAFADPTGITSLSSIGSSGDYIITADIDASGFTNSIASFSGTLTARAKDDGTFPVISGLTVPIFSTATGATISYIMLKDIAVTGSGPIGAICGTANGTTRIYNCGILPNLNEISYDQQGNITGFNSTVSSDDGNCGGLVGTLAGNARVINCFSYANITDGTTVAGIVGNNTTTSITQANVTTVGMVVNCMFYGDITGGSTISPVYGGNMIKTDATNGVGVNPYCYFRGSALFNNGTNFSNIDDYKRSWPVDEEYLTRFEYYRSILNSNKKLCTYWVTDKVYGSPTDAPTDADEALIAKWVLDPAIAPYPILKKWGKYPSIINPDKAKTIDPRLRIEENNNGTVTVTSNVPQWTTRSAAYKGKIFKNLKVTVNPGNHAASGVESKIISLPITDMDTLNFDYGYYKVQLPYYNEQFGDPTADPATEWDKRYGGNYKDFVVTGWKITGIIGGTAGTFTENWESGYNFADRYCTNKDLYSVSKRVFAQGGFFYVPEGVTDITIEAYWGKAVYLHNTGHYLDRVNITNQTANGNLKLGNPFTPSGTLSTTFQNQTVKDSWIDAVKALDAATVSGSGANTKLNLSVYDQAIVLLSNLQWRNENSKVGTDIDSKWHPYTIMSIDQDLDNEPDFCFEFQYRNQWERKGIQPIRFDFLPVPELGMAVRHSKQQNTIGIFVPQGHFEITETSYMHTTQFEYDANAGRCGTKIPAPIILNGGHFEQIIVRYDPQNNTQYFLMGGHFRMLRFALSAHPNKNQSAKIRLCAVNAIGGEYPEFYLSGIYRPDITPVSVEKQGNPHCYTNGGYFHSMAGAGYEKILGNVTFNIDHSIIDEFYGGGINGSKPIGGSINVTINNSLVGKYCGGPKVGTMTTDKTVTTHATGTTFTHYYGGGNGGTSYYREQVRDGNDWDMPAPTAEGWKDFGYGTFNPLNTISGLSKQYEGPEDNSENKGYHALFEFECFVESNGLGQKPTLRSYRHWAQFGTTSTGNVTNILNNCTINNSFYGGGNLANVNGTVTSTLTDCTIKGNVFGGGYSGKIEPFRIHDKSKTEFPYIDDAGVMQNGNGKFEYVKNADGTDRYYTWCYRKSATEFFPEGVIIPSDASTDTNLKSTFEYPENSNNWYVLTTVSLEGLGAVSSNTTLTITTSENGASTIGTVGDPETGNVYGGGNESAVNGNTTVTLNGNTTVLGDVFGGGNKAEVGGSSEVIIKQEQN